MSSKLRVGVVGCGILGTNHANFFARHRRTTLVAVADRLGRRAARPGRAPRAGARPRPRPHVGRARSRAGAAGSTVAQFLFSHVVDRMRWIFEPAEVEEVRAIAVRRVLGATPDLFDAHLTWSNGLVLRIKAEWIRHIE